MTFKCGQHSLQGMLRLLLCGTVSLGALVLLAEETFAQSIIQWVNQNTPVGVIGPVSPAQCQALQNKWDTLFRQINETHSSCLQTQGRQRNPPRGTNCSYQACEAAHTLMNDRSLVEKRRSQVNVCFAALRDYQEREQDAKAKQAEVDRKFNESLLFGTKPTAAVPETRVDLSGGQKGVLKDWVNLLNSEQQLNEEYEQALEKRRALKNYVRKEQEQKAEQAQWALEGGASGVDQAYEVGKNVYEKRELADPKVAAKAFREGGRDLSNVAASIDDYFADVLKGTESVGMKEAVGQVPWKSVAKGMGTQALKETAMLELGGAVNPLLDPPPEAGETHIDDNPVFGTDRETSRRQEKDEGETFVAEVQGRERLAERGAGVTIQTTPYPQDPYRTELRADRTPPPSLYSPLGQVKGWVAAFGEPSESWPFIDRETRQMGRVTKERAGAYQPGHERCSTIRIEVFREYDKREEICD